MIDFELCSARGGPLLVQPLALRFSTFLHLKGLMTFYLLFLSAPSHTPQPHP